MILDPYDMAILLHVARMPHTDHEGILKGVGELLGAHNVDGRVTANRVAKLKANGSMSQNVHGKYQLTPYGKGRVREAMRIYGRVAHLALLTSI